MEGLAAFVTKSFNAESKTNSENELPNEMKEEQPSSSPEQPTDLSIKCKEDTEIVRLPEEVTKTEYVETNELSDSGMWCNILLLNNECYVVIFKYFIFQNIFASRRKLKNV